MCIALSAVFSHCSRAPCSQRSHLRRRLKIGKAQDVVAEGVVDNNVDVRLSVLTLAESQQHESLNAVDSWFARHVAFSVRRMNKQSNHQSRSSVG